MEEWSRAVAQAVTSKNPQTLASLFSLETGNNVAVLQNALWQGFQIDTFRPEWNWPALAAFARDYLNWCYHINPLDPLAARPLLQKMFTSLQTAFSQAEGWLLNMVVQRFVSGRLDIWVAGPLLRIFNNILSERDATKKQNILLWCATRLCRIYMHKDQFNLCQTVFRSLDTKDITKYSIAQQVELRYAKGRYTLRQDQISDSFEHLQWAYCHCVEGPNKRRILGQMLLPGLLSGRMPSAQAMAAAQQQSQGLWEAVGLLATAIRQVRLDMYEQALGLPWIQEHRLGALVRVTVPTLICRRALGRLVRSLGAPKSISFAQARAALQAAGYADADSDFLVTETMCIALVNQRYVYANIFPNVECGQSVLRLRPKDPVPSLAKVYS